MAVYRYQYKTRKGAMTRYRYQFMVKGVRYMAAGFKTAATAKDAEAARRKMLRQKQTGPELMPFLTAWNNYEEDKRGRLEPTTVDQKMTVLARLLVWMQDHGHIHDIKTYPLQGISREHVRQFVAEQYRARGPKSANRDLREIMAFYSWCVQEGKAQLNPAKNIKKYPTEEFIKYVPPAEDIKAVLMAAGREEMDLLLAYYHTAARQREIFQLKKRDVILDQNVLRLWTKKKKDGSKRYRPIRMNRILREIVERRMKESPSEYVFHNHRSARGCYHRNQHVVKFLMARLCHKAGVPFFTIHSIRHHVSALLRGRGADLKQLQQFLGHDREATTEGYLKSLLVDLDDVAGMLEGEEEDASNNRSAE